MENLCPEVHVISLGHQASLVTVGDVLNDSVLALQLNELSPDGFLLLDELAPVEINVFDSLF